MTHSGFPRLRQLLIRGLGGLVGVLVVMAMAGSTYQTVSTMLDERVHPAPGRLVDAGGYRLHLNLLRTGQPDRPPGVQPGQPLRRRGHRSAADRGCDTRLLVRPGGDRLERSWSGAARLSKYRRRAPQPAPHSERVRTPHVLAGHSFGGLYVRTFTAYCADEKAYRDARFKDACVAEMGAPKRDAQVRATPGLDNRPLVAIRQAVTSTSAYRRGLWRNRRATGAGSRRTSPLGRTTANTCSWHGTLQTAYAANISEAILRVVDAVRRGSPMGGHKRKAVIE